MDRAIVLRFGWLAFLAGSAAPLSGQVRLPKPVITQPTIVAPTSGRYRVVISGFAVNHETRDGDSDGAKDEVYAGAAFVLWDRRDGHMISMPNIVRTREYGDIGGRNSTRIRAGSASRSGGLWGANGIPDYAPVGYDPRANLSLAPAYDQFPLLVFEGGLSDGVEALLVAPSLWESDGRSHTFDNYSTNWRAGGVTRLLGSPAVQNQLTNSSLTSAVVPGDPTLQTIAQVANFFTGGIVGSYMIGASTLVTAMVDRPIGLAPMQNADQYQDRVVVVTREKLASLAVGAGFTIAIPFAEPYDQQLNGVYTLYMRVERIQ
jgi:hypothetical protein